MKRQKLFTLAAPLLAISVLSGCSAMPTVTWKNWDGTVLEVDKRLVLGEKTKYDGEEPTKPSTDQYDYIFSGWDLDSAHAGRVYKSRIITAQFEEILRNYTITWNIGGNVEKTTVPYGMMPSFSAPTIKSDGFRKVFSHWEPEITKVTKDASYTAIYTTQYERTITFKDHSGIIEQSTYYDGTKASDMEIPEPENWSDPQYFHTFEKWDTEITDVDADKTYTAKYKDELRSYQVTWKDWDGTVLKTISEVPYGETVNFDGETPTKERDYDYTYEFSGWSPAEGPVTGDITYTANYDRTKRNVANVSYYIVSFDINGNITSINQVSNDSQLDFEAPYNETFVLKPLHKEKYEFNWYLEPSCETKVEEVTDITNNMTFFGKFTPITYSISFEGGEGVENVPTVSSFTCEDGLIVFPNLTKEGYDFDGYYIGEDKLERNEFDCANYTNTVVTIKFNQYTITYKGVDDITTDNLPTSYCSSTGVIELPLLTKDGYEFKGYSIDGKLLDDNKFDTSEYLVNRDGVEIVAEFENITHTIDFDLNGGYAPITVKFTDGSDELTEYTVENFVYGNEPISYPVLKNKNGKQFAGWDNKPTSPLDSDLVLKAKWNEIEEGVVDMPIDSKEYTTVSLHNMNDTCVQVTSLYNQTLSLEFEDNNSIPMIEADTVIDSYLLLNKDGDVYKSNRTFDVKAGETFSFVLRGKTTEDSTTNVKVVSSNKTPDSVITVAENTEFDSLSVIKGDTFMAPRTPIRNGYVFGGWFEETDTMYEKEYTSSTILELNTDIKLVAKWVPAE